MPIWKVKSIGVDFGSSTTCVMAHVEREKESKLVCFGYQGRNVFDTLIGTKTNGQVVYFSDALFAKPQEIDSINGSIKEGSLLQFGHALAVTDWISVFISTIGDSSIFVSQ